MVLVKVDMVFLDRINVKAIQTDMASVVVRRQWSTESIVVDIWAGVVADLAAR